MEQPNMVRKVYDCFLYNGEIDALEIRLHELAEVVHRFVIVEADTNFSGLRKKLTFDPFDQRVTAFTSTIRYVVVSDMPPTEDPLRRESWQRNAILRGIPDSDEDDLVMVSNVDEIPRAAAVRDIFLYNESRIFGLHLAFYCFFVNYRNISGPESAIPWTIAARRSDFERVAPHDLRYGVRNGHFPARIVPEAGWHFSHLLDEAGVRRKLAAYSPQQGNNDRLLSINVPRIVRCRGNLFGRLGSRWDIVDPKELPSWLRANRRALSRLFYPRTTVGRLTSRIVPSSKRQFCASGLPAAKPPVIICPYIHSHEASEISAKFGLGRRHGRKIEFFLWQDTNRLGPERAFQHCWDQFPDRDIVVLHSDMAPMPNDQSNRWYDQLLQYRDRLPNAGLLACNLYYPRTTPDEPWRVQCAGGTFREGKIGHLHGGIQEDKLEGISDVALRTVRAVDWVTFGGVLIRREVIQACGPFDGRYRWAYVMDVDYCFEARLRGFRAFQIPVSLQHEENRTTRVLWETDSRLRDQMVGNFALFYEKWRPFAAALAPAAVLIAKEDLAEVPRE
jgi:beta-1,4-mannosyl-glycoprotein beta-1,4-N-acetylglucosaminyltransferase